MKQERTVIHTDKAPPPGPYSQAIACNGFVFVSGQTSDDPVTHEPVHDSVASPDRADPHPHPLYP